MLNILVGWRRVMHKFKIGERLFPARSVGFSVPDGAYVVVKRLPMRDGEFEYQIKNLTEPDERVVRESRTAIKSMGKQAGPAGRTLAWVWNKTRVCLSLVAART